MPHLHLSMQAGDDLILKRMKRRHSGRDALATVARARALRPGIAFGADLIAGFPTETEAMFEETLSLCRGGRAALPPRVSLQRAPGTPAARMPPVAKPVRRERAARLREAGSARPAAFLAAQVGRTVSVLVESGGRRPQRAFRAGPADPPGPARPCRRGARRSARRTRHRLAEPV